MTEGAAATEGAAVTGAVKSLRNIGVSSNNCAPLLTFGVPMKSTAAPKSFGKDTTKPAAPNARRTLESEGNVILK